MAFAKFEPDESDFLAAAIKYNGSLTKLARHYNIAKDTIYQYIKRSPAGKRTIDKVRGLNQETHLDLAEQVFIYNMANLERSPGLAQRAAEKVMDKLGHLRGWSGSENLSADDMQQAIKELCQKAESQE